MISVIWYIIRAILAVALGALIMWAPVFYFLHFMRNR